MLAGAPDGRADGLQRFELLLPAIRAQATAAGTGFAYKSAAPIGASGFMLEGVTVDLPPDPPGTPPSRLTIRRVVVDDLDFDRIDLGSDGKPGSGPYFAKATAEGIMVTGAMQQQIQALKLPATSMDVAVDFRYDEARKVLAVNRLQAVVPGLATLDLNLTFDGVPPPGAAAAEQAQNDTTLRSASLTFDDHSLLSQVVPPLSELAGMAPKQGIAMLRGVLGGMLAGQSAVSRANGDALLSYAMDWQAPKGPLTLRLTPAPNTTLAEVQKITTPDEAARVLGLVVSYSGTRDGISGGAAGPRVAPGGGASPPVAALCVAKRRVYVVDTSDGTLTAGTVVEFEQGKRCIVRPEGGTADDDMSAAPADLRRWSLEGPGAPLGQCVKDASVLAHKDRDWLIGTVKGPGRGGRCDVVLEDEVASLPMTALRRDTGQ